MQHSSRASAKSVKRMPFDASLFHRRDNHFPRQVPGVDWLLRISPMEDVAVTTVSLQVRFKVLLHNPDDRDRCFAARRLGCKNFYRRFDSAPRLQHYLVII